jgi:hypothetical protein
MAPGLVSHDTGRYDRTIRLSRESLADPPMCTLDMYNARATADEVDKALSNHKVFSPICLSTEMVDINLYLDRILNLDITPHVWQRRWWRWTTRKDA